MTSTADETKAISTELAPPTARTRSGFEGIPMPVWAKFALCIGFDLFDLTIGRFLLGISIFTDVVSALIMFALWGPKGLLAIWEVFDPTEQIDGFVPSNTIIAWMAHKK